MKVIHHYNNFPKSIKTVITIGTFDGVHIGHREIIETLTNAADEKGLKSVLLTFFPHPRMVIQSNDSIKLIHTIDERIETLSKTGLDYLIIHPFDKDFANLTAFDFVRDVLVNQLNVEKLIIGYDHRFGKNREGDFESLKEYSHMFDFELREIPSQNVNEIAVSSTKIRNAITAGHMKTASKYLTQPFFIKGTIVKGEQIGNTIGFPTANIAVSATYKLIPKNGAYLVKCYLKEKVYYGMLNIGNRPTVLGKKQTIEAHIFDFDDDIYDEEIKVAFLSFLRDEKKFDSLDDLKNQLSEDKKQCLTAIQKISL